MTEARAPTGIVVTVGPATDTAAALAQVMNAGATGFRVPLARQWSRAASLRRSISEVSGNLGVPARVFLDIPGPKKHLVVPRAMVLQDGAEVSILVLPRGAPSPPGTVHVLADAPASYFSVGDVLLLGDGETAFTVVGVTPGELRLRSHGAPVPAGRFGIAVAGKEGHASAAPLDSATARLVWSIPDVIVIGSFIESAAQVAQMRRLLPPRQAVWAKVETRRGVANVEDITAEADGILLGRGDLLIDVGDVDYFDCEQHVIGHVTRAGVPLMVGTQLWTSSSAMFLPHRSELSYLCGLLSRGIDSILLSDETTVGEHPERTVTQMTRLIARYGQS